MAWHPRTLTVAQKEERRREAARLLRRGWTQAAVAEEVGASPAAVCGWAKRLQAGGLRALKARKHPGAPSRLSPAQWQELARVLKAGALAAGFSTERWTLTRVAHVIQKRFGVHYHPHYLAEPLHRLGFTPQRPPTQARERATRAGAVAPLDARLQHRSPPQGAWDALASRIQAARNCGPRQRGVR